MSIRLALEIGTVTVFHLVLWENQAEEEAEVTIPVVTDVSATEHYSTGPGFHTTLEPHWDEDED